MTLQDYLTAGDKKTLFQEIFSQAKEKNKENPAILRREDDYVLTHQKEFFSKKFAGCPIVLKDNILLQGTISSFGSPMGENYLAPYSANVLERLEEAGFLTIGKATMDEFAMGSSGENSVFPVPHNTKDHTRVAGGSSSGSAVAVAQGQVAVALGTDTGGSVRQPAAFNGIYGLKPSYGAVSRYGVQAMASSFDQVGIFATNIQDIEAVFETIAGHDPRDATSQQIDFTRKISGLSGLRIGVPIQYFSEGLDLTIKTRIEEVLERCRSQGAHVIEIDLPLLDAGVSVYYTLVDAEVSTNLARFDGLKFGHQLSTRDFQSHEKYLQKVRSQFGEEAKRRILLGAHVLSASEYEGLYLKASHIRRQITKDLFDRFEGHIDVIMGPTTPVFPWRLSDQQDNPMASYLADIYTVIANLSGLPALSVPVGMGKNSGTDLPIGLQIMGRYAGEYDLFTLAQSLEAFQVS